MPNFAVRSSSAAIPATTTAPDEVGSLAILATLPDGTKAVVLLLANDGSPREGGPTPGKDPTTQRLLITATATLLGAGVGWAVF